MAVNYKIEGNSLIITAGNDSRAVIADELREYGYQAAESAVCEGLQGMLEPILPEYIGALTDAPIFTASDFVLGWDDGGAIELAPDYWVAWFPDYAVIDPWATLANTGRVVFQIVQSDERAA